MFNGGLEMFRENTNHQQSFFDSADTMAPQIKERLDKIMGASVLRTYLLPD